MFALFTSPRGSGPRILVRRGEGSGCCTNADAPESQYRRWCCRETRKSRASTLHFYGDRRSNVSLWIGLACTRLSCLYCLRRRSWLRSHSSSHVAQRNSTTFLRANTEKHAAIHHHIHTYGQFSHTGRVRTSLQSEPSPFLAMVLTTSPLCCLRAIRPIFVAHIKGKWASETNQIKGCVFTCLFHFKCNNRLRVWDKHLWLRSDIYYCKRLIDCF